MTEGVTETIESLTAEERQWLAGRANSAIFEDPERGVCALQAASTGHKGQDTMFIGDGVLLVADGVTGVNGRGNPNIPENAIGSRQDHICYGEIASSYAIDTSLNLRNGNSTFDEILHHGGPGAVASRALAGAVLAISRNLDLPNSDDAAILQSIMENYQKLLDELILQNGIHEQLKKLKNEFEGFDNPYINFINFASNLVCVLDAGEELILVVVGDSCIEVEDDTGKLPPYTKRHASGATDSFQAIAHVPNAAGIKMEHKTLDGAQIVRLKKNQVKSLKLYTDGYKRQNRDYDDVSMINVYDVGKFF